MTDRRAGGDAFGAPGIEPRWTHGGKDAVGTAHDRASRVWFTLWNGVVTEVYYPTVDRPQMRDLQFLVTDGRTFFHDEKRDLRSTTSALSPHALAFHVVSEDPTGRYAIEKDVITDPIQPCVLQRVRFRGDAAFLATLRVYALAAPHLQVGGWANDARVEEVAGRRVLTAEKGGVWLVLGASGGFDAASCGYVGTSDGWTDLHQDRTLDWSFERALGGNVALIGEVAAGATAAFTLAVAFGDSKESAATTLFEALATPFDRQLSRFVEQWERIGRRLATLDPATGDGGRLYRRSASLILAHEDKTFPGALIASLSIPWGEVRGDDDQGGYHLVWTRDMVNSAGGLLAAGLPGPARRALVYLCVAQRADGGFPQNFWIDGEPYWQGIQLDEVAFPILLAWRLRAMDALDDFDPSFMVLRAAAYLVRHGPATEQDRWEEAGGYSPATLASNIAALVCAADFARGAGDPGTARFLLEYADFLERHVEAWTVTTNGSLLTDVARHYIRILPVTVDDVSPDEDPDRGEIRIANRAPGERAVFPAREIVDAGFLDLVRYGIRRAGSALMEDSLRVVDAALRVDTPGGPVWRRYNHDGYGQRDDGSAFDGWGRGRAWPLLAGERGHYELAAGRDPGPYLRALEWFATDTGLLTEQVWDAPDLPAAHMRLGRPTGAAMPLMWAHAEYIKLLRSATDSEVWDRVTPVALRYLGDRHGVRELEVWKPNRRVRAVLAGRTLRIVAPAAFTLHWSDDDWVTVHDDDATVTGLGLGYVDLPTRAGHRAPLRFTFHRESGWEGEDHEVEVVQGSPS